MKSRAKAGAGIASVASVVLGVLAVLTALYGFSQDPPGTELFNRFKIGVGAEGPLITVVAIGVVCAIAGLRGRPRWPAITGIVLNAVALLIAVLVKIAVEHGVGA
jgi:hypothetical protein